MAEPFDSSRPIYAQLVERLQGRIIAGEYPPGARLASVRELAAAAGVNPNTMQRALAELERRGLVYTERTAGRFVTTDPARIEALKLELIQNEVRQFAAKMQEMGCPPGRLARLFAALEQETDAGTSASQTGEGRTV